MSRIATVRPVGHIGQRNVRRRVGPEQLSQIGLRPPVDATDARKHVRNQDKPSPQAEVKLVANRSS
jgi:hypothetical protein